MAKPFSQMNDTELLAATGQMITGLTAAPATYHTTAAAVTAFGALPHDLRNQLHRQKCRRLSIARGHVRQEHQPPPV